MGKSKHARGHGGGTWRGQPNRNSKNSRNSEQQDVQNRVLTFLHREMKPVRPITIARALGMQTAKEINPTLYGMMQSGQLHKRDGSPPLWEVAKAMSELAGAGASSVGSSSIVDMPVYQTQQQGHGPKQQDAINRLYPPPGSPFMTHMAAYQYQQPKTSPPETHMIVEHAYQPHASFEEVMETREGSVQSIVPQSDGFEQFGEIGKWEGKESSDLSESIEETTIGTATLHMSCIPEQSDRPSDKDVLSILSRLQRMPSASSSTLDLYQTLGYPSEGDVLSVLAFMAREGMVMEMKFANKPVPEWHLKKRGRDVLVEANAPPAVVLGVPPASSTHQRASSIPLTPKDSTHQRASSIPLTPKEILRQRQGLPPLPPDVRPPTWPPPTFDFTRGAISTRAPRPPTSHHHVQPRPVSPVLDAPPPGGATVTGPSHPGGFARYAPPLSSVPAPQPPTRPPVTPAITPGARESFTESLARPAPSSRPSPSADPPDEVELKLMYRLSRLQDNVSSTLDLSGSLGGGTKADVNPTLYGMEKKGWVRKNQDTPPMWKLLNSGKAAMRGDTQMSEGPGTFTPPAPPTALVPTRAPQPSSLPATTLNRSPPPMGRGRGLRPASPADILRARAAGAQVGSAAPSLTSAPSPYVGEGTPYPAPPSGSPVTVVTGAAALAALSGQNFAALNKNPVSALMEYAQSRKMAATIEVLSQSGPPHKPRFRMAAMMGGRIFPDVECSSKKEGKTEAADVALRILMGEGQLQTPAQQPGSLAPPGGRPATHFDHVAGLCHLRFNALAAGIGEMMAGKKVLAGIVMKSSAQDEGSVICLGTGNRCITGEHLSLEGKTVNDSHAEIITRRSFIRFLYQQLLSTTPGAPDSILEPSPSGRLRVKENITFHLYISTAPCGDGALFSPRDADKAVADPVALDQAHTPTFSSKVQGILRTKMEGGEGTIPIEAGFKGQTWDGILRGERLRTMSCSDKVCRWNLVGMQGALLSHLLDPVYMASLTLGNLYDHGHLSRAVCCRLGHGYEAVESALPRGYRVNHPHLGRVTAYEPPREIQKSKEYSVNWCAGDATAEVTDGTRGTLLKQCDGDYVSRLSKSHMFARFRGACARLGRAELAAAGTYGQTKARAADYSRAKLAMLEQFKAQGYSTWVGKPVEEEMFE